MINNKYEILNKIGNGEFGTIFQGKNIRTNEHVAIKIESLNAEIKLLKNECIILQYLSNTKGICALKWFGKYADDFYVIITTLLQMSIEDLKNANDHKTLSFEKAIEIGCRTIEILQSIHNKHILHRDVKADNLMYDINNHLHLIDFGLSTCFINVETKEHKEMKTTTNLIGTPTFLSTHGHRLCELSRRDDLESVGYMMIYLIKGTLKWSHLDIKKNFDKTNAVIRKAKENIDKIYADIPLCILNYIHHVQQIEYKETPNYISLISILNN